MSEEIIRRRGRPPLSIETSVEAEQAPIPKSSRRRRASVGAASLKLSAPTREGYTRRWVNDDGNNLAEKQELAYEFITETGITSSDPGSRISRLVGTKANGEPLRAYLMETPNELYAEGVAEKEAHNRQIDEAIAAGNPTEDSHNIPHREIYGEGSIRR